MGMPDLPAQGGCRCGAVRIMVTLPPLFTAACHCTGCQRMSASAFSLTAAIPAEGLHVTAGAPVLGGLRGGTRHYFCPDCMSWMFTRPEGVDQFVNLRPAMLDDPSWCVPFIETCTREALPWARTPAPHRYAGFPPMEEFGPLLAAFAAWSADTGQKPDTH